MVGCYTCCPPNIFGLLSFRWSGRGWEKALCGHEYKATCTIASYHLDYRWELAHASKPEMTDKKSEWQILSIYCVENWNHLANTNSKKKDNANMLLDMTRGREIDLVTTYWLSADLIYLLCHGLSSLKTFDQPEGSLREGNQIIDQVPNGKLPEQEH